eukprot:s1917_g7.t1
MACLFNSYRQPKFRFLKVVVKAAAKAPPAAPPKPAVAKAVNMLPQVAKAPPASPAKAAGAIAEASAAKPAEVVPEPKKKRKKVVKRVKGPVVDPYL